MRSSIIPSRWLGETGRRLDPGPYLSGAIEAKETLRVLKVRKSPLSTLTMNGEAGIFHAGRIGRSYVIDPREGIPFLGSTDILAGDLSYLPLLSKRLVASYPKFVIRKDWTLITRSGTVGRMAYSRPDMDGLACSEHVMRVVADPDQVPPGYLFAFLSSRFGVPMVTSGTYGAIIQHIEPEHIANLPVPRFGAAEESVHKLVVESARLRSFCQTQLMAATEHLFRSVNLTDMTPAEWHSGGANLGFSVPRVDRTTLRAVNFNPRFQALCNRLRSVPHSELGSLCQKGSLHRGGRYKRIDAQPEFGVELIGQKQLFWLRSEGRFLAKKGLPKDVFVKAGGILVAAQGTLGESELFCRAELVWGGMTKKAYSEHLLRILADEREVEFGYLFAFARSETMFRMLRSISTGTKLQDHHPRLLNGIPVPMASEQVRKEIHNQVVEAVTARDKALLLENEAISKTEELIAGGC